jgi:hypothetical protein
MNVENKFQGSLIVEIAVRNIGDKWAEIFKHIIKNFCIYLGVMTSIQNLPSTF